jgi:hypothetical protein
MYVCKICKYKRGEGVQAEVSINVYGPFKGRGMCNGRVRNRDGQAEVDEETAAVS